MRIIEGDCREAMAAMDGGVFDACVTDPPYELGFMGKAWDARGVAFDPATWRAVLRVLKPGAHLLAFGGTRTFHRMACAIEDAGFEIRDTIMWVYGSGFPKSHDVAKGIDKAAGTKGTFGAPKSAAHAGWIDRGRLRGDDNEEGWQRPWMADPAAVDNAARQYIPATEAARQWQGWGTALKPAWEPVIVARKPLIGTAAENVLAHGTGALNIDGCRVEARDKTPAPVGQHGGSTVGTTGHTGRRDGSADHLGRWPANVIHDGSDEVLEAFAFYGADKGQAAPLQATGRARPSKHALGDMAAPVACAPRDALGTAARFFYSAKAGKEDRAGSRHPTVKPIALMRYLCRLVTPPGGHILDPFAGSGTTLAAAFHEGFQATAIEQEAEHAADCRRRLLALQMAALPPELRDLIG